jgi:photosystem II PsbU protein
MERGRKTVKQLVRLLTVFSLVLGCLGWLGTPKIAQAASFNSFALPTVPVLAVEENQALRNRADAKLAKVYGEKIDLNNTNVRAFQKYPGLYPTLARKIITHAPYQKIEDVLSIEGLSAHQKQILQANLENFTLSEMEPVFTEGDDRFNNGIYR